MEKPQFSQSVEVFFIDMYTVYILYSVNFDKFYVGQTDNMDDRIRRHNGGYNLSTKPYRPWMIKLTIPKATRADAMLLERKLKNLSKDRLSKFISKYASAGADEA